MPTIIKKKSSVVFIVIIAVVFVLFGIMLGLFIWKFLQLSSLNKRLIVLSSCTPPPAPTGVVATHATTPALTIIANWTAVPSATSYTVVVAPAAGGPPIFTNSTEVTVNITVPATGAYDLWVQATVPCGDGTTATKSNAIFGIFAAAKVPMLSNASNVVSITVT